MKKILSKIMLVFLGGFLITPTSFGYLEKFKEHNNCRDKPIVKIKPLPIPITISPLICQLPSKKQFVAARHQTNLIPTSAAVNSDLILVGLPDTSFLEIPSFSEVLVNPITIATNVGVNEGVSATIITPVVNDSETIIIGDLGETNGSGIVIITTKPPNETITGNNNAEIDTNVSVSTGVAETPAGNVQGAEVENGNADITTTSTEPTKNDPDVSGEGYVSVGATETTIGNTVETEIKAEGSITGQNSSGSVTPTPIDSIDVNANVSGSVEQTTPIVTNKKNHASESTHVHVDKSKDKKKITFENKGKIKHGHKNTDHNDQVNIAKQHKQQIAIDAKIKNLNFEIKPNKEKFTNETAVQSENKEVKNQTEVENLNDVTITHETAASLNEYPKEVITVEPVGNDVVTTSVKTNSKGEKTEIEMETNSKGEVTMKNKSKASTSVPSDKSSTSPDSSVVSVEKQDSPESSKASVAAHPPVNDVNKAASIPPAATVNVNVNPGAVNPLGK